VASGGQAHRAIAALHQLHIQLLFQFLDVRCHIRLHGVQPLCGGTKAAGAANGIKNAQRFKLHGHQSQKKMMAFILNHWT
jgi:hypothetical protein